MPDIVLVDFTQRDRYPYVVHNGYRYLASYARSRGRSVRILYNAAYLDADALEAEYLAALAADPPLLVGLSPIDGSFERIAAFASALRRRGVRSAVALGGSLATFNDGAILADHPQFDLVVRGEGEATLVEVVEALAAGRGLGGVAGVTYRERGAVVANPPRPFLRDLDALPLAACDGYDRAAREGTPMEQAIVASSRGCSRRCSFCSVSSFCGLDPSTPAWRGRSIGAVVDEIEHLHRTYGIPFFSLCDDNFIGPGRAGRQRALDFSRDLRARRLDVRFEIFCRADTVDEELIGALCEAGLQVVFFGLESGLQRALDTFEKRTSVARNEEALRILLGHRQLGVVVGYIFFDPYLSVRELRENAAYLEKLLALQVEFNPANPLRSCLVPYSGTPIQRRLREDGLLAGDYASGYTCRFVEPRVEAVSRLVANLDTLLWASWRSASQLARKELQRRSLALQVELVKRLGAALEDGPEVDVAEALSRPQVVEPLRALLSATGAGGADADAPAA